MIGKVRYTFSGVSNDPVLFFTMLKDKDKQTYRKYAWEQLVKLGIEDKVARAITLYYVVR